MAQQPHEPNGDRQRREEAARTPEQDHTPRREEQAARERREAQKTRAAPVDKAAAETREAQAAASIGAQIILDYNEDGSKGARGGAGGTVEENTMAKDAPLVALGLDPLAPSGPPPTPEALAARRKREEADARAAADPQFMVPPNGKAARMSSLAAGLDAGDIPPPTEPPPTVRGGAA